MGEVDLHMMRPARARASVVPVVQLTQASFTVNRGDALRPDYQDVVLPVLALCFEYDGRRHAASDLALLSPVPAAVRDLPGEQAARVLIEKLGAVDLDCLDDYGRDADDGADYLISLTESPSAYCAFTAFVVPELIRRGFVVEIDPAFPYRLVDRDVQWYTELVEAEGADWFGLELGVEIDGQRVNLVPVLLSLVQRSGEIEELKALARGADKLLVVQAEAHGYVQVDVERLKRLCGVVLELYDRTSGPVQRLRVRKDRADDLAWVERLVDGEASDADSESRSSNELPRTALPDSLPVKATLRPYQREGVAFLQAIARAGRGGVLADDMGLGKTLQTIAHLALERVRTPLAPPSLIVCPTSLVGNWQRELLRFAPQLRVRAYHGPDRAQQAPWLDTADVVITTYPILLRDTEVLNALAYHALVLDEAQTIKNAKSTAHQAVKCLRADHRICLSGTPIENHVGELWALFDFLMPGMLGDESSFRAEHGTYDPRDLRDAARRESLRARIGPFIVRRMKEAVAPELPGKISSVVPVVLSGKQRELYESIRSAAHQDVRRAIRHKGVEGSTLLVLDALTKLRQVCCDPRLVKLEAARFVRESAKLEALVRLVDAHLGVGRRVLIFSQFTSMLSLIAEALRAKDIDTITLTGDTRDRSAVVDAFQRMRADVFLISLKAGGTGLNLVSADTVIHYDPWWNPAAQDQATDRAYRIGQQKPVLVQELLVAGSIEERIRALAEKKRAFAASLLSCDVGAATHLTEADVDDLFAPLAT